MGTQRSAVKLNNNRYCYFNKHCSTLYSYFLFSNFFHTTLFCLHDILAIFFVDFVSRPVSADVGRSYSFWAANPISVSSVWSVSTISVVWFSGSLSTVSTISVTGISISVPGFWGGFSFGFWFSYSSGFGISRSLATVSTVSVTTISITASISIAIVRFSGTLSTVTTISITTITVSTAIVTIGIGLRFCRDDGNNESYENS